MTEKERDQLRAERWELSQKYRLSDTSEENIARKARIDEITELLGGGKTKQRKSWMDRRPPLIRMK